MAAVEVDQDQVQQGHALREAVGDAVPLAAADEHGNAVEFPGAIFAAGLAKDVVRHAVFAEQSAGLFGLTGEAVGADFLERSDQTTPSGPHLT
ncbi:MAG: hypothetical protein QM775_27075 [Pirellulales bacterium]